jgi:hypothetical protein
MIRRPEPEKKKSNEGSGKEDAIEVMATVVEPLPNAMFRVELENKHQVLGSHFGKDAQEFYPHSARRSRGGGAFAVRPHARPDRVPI